MKLRRNIEVELSLEEQFDVVRAFVKNKPEAVKILLEYPKGYCPFPSSCGRFPCNTLNCNADTCSNGHAYRMS